MGGRERGIERDSERDVTEGERGRDRAREGERERESAKGRKRERESE